jgi:quinol monooxygenase YgiN
MIHVDGTVQLSADSQKLLLPIMREAMAATVQEEGCLVFRFTADIAAPDLFHMSELWESEAALKTHMQAPSFTNAIGALLQHAKILNLVARQGELAPYDLSLPV